MGSLWTLTTGEHARICLDSLELIDAADPETEPTELGQTAFDFALACAGLISKFPSIYGKRVAHTLPFTSLERAAYIAQPNILDNTEVREQLAKRLGSWARMGYAEVEGRIIRCGDFLRELSPHLDTLGERALAQSKANDMDRRAADAPV